jgi:hypothetical protein
VVELFAAVRLAQQDNGEPGDVDIINGRVLPDKPEEKEYDYTPTKQYAYS